MLQGVVKIIIAKLGHMQKLIQGTDKTELKTHHTQWALLLMENFMWYNIIQQVSINIK